MMAAATSDQPKVQYHTAIGKRELLSLGNESEDGKPTSDVSEQEFFDAQSQVSLNSPSEPDDSLEPPKIVETVAKKLLETENRPNVGIGDSETVVERDIRMQQEREAVLARERVVALLKVSKLADAHPSPPPPPPPPLPTPAEAKIALELREMREREDELKRLRQQISLNGNEALVTDDDFNSIPNTDEGNFSEHGSEEKELSLDGNNSRMMSPEVPASSSFSHQRTQSFDSMSSGHSSGSGSGGNAEYFPNRRRIIVKPLEEPDIEHVPSCMRNIRNSPGVPEVDLADKSTRRQKETPIEREIRLTRDREEELRREKGLYSNVSSSTLSSIAAKQEGRHVKNRPFSHSNDSRSVQHRLATSRIQQEINEATEREKELRAAGMIQTMSEDTVDSKVTRFTDLVEYAIEEKGRKLQKSVSTSNLTTTVPAEVGGVSTVPLKLPQKPVSFTTPSCHSAAMRPVTTISPKKFSPVAGQKGLMQRFLASHGKVNVISSTRKNNTPPQPSPVAAPIFTLPMVHKKSIDLATTMEHQVPDDMLRTPVRRGYQSAEEKIQVELQEMQKREEELRLQRAQMFAQSQPNLLFIGHEEEASNMNEDFNQHMVLRTVLSNPNLLDSEDSSRISIESSLDKSSYRSTRKQNHLIAEWEKRIKNNTDH